MPMTILKKLHIFHGHLTNPMDKQAKNVFLMTLKEVATMMRNVPQKRALHANCPKIFFFVSEVFLKPSFITLLTLIIFCQLMLEKLVLKDFQAYHQLLVLLVIIKKMFGSCHLMELSLDIIMEQTIFQLVCMNGLCTTQQTQKQN